MAMPTGSALVVLVLAVLAPSALGHGWITEPPARNAPRGPRNGYCPHCGNGGGVCGDGGQWPGSSNYVGGENAGPQRTYTAGEVVEFAIRITAHHRGHMELHICDEHLGPLTQNPEGPNGCLSKWVLERVPPEQVYSDCAVNDARDDCQPLDTSHPERWYLSPGTGEHRMHFRIPEGLRCATCTLQWRWWTANSCTPAPGYGCYFSRMNALGWDAASWCGVFCGSCSSSLLESNASRAEQHAGSGRGCGEEFRNCADITVLASDGSPGPSPAPSPVPSPVPTPMLPVTTTRAPAPAGSCVQNTDCAANAWCNDPAYVSWCAMHSAAQCPSPQCMLASSVPSPAPMPSTTPAPATTTKMTTMTTTMPVQTTAAPAPAPTPVSCASCLGENACVWTDGQCYPFVAQEVCETTQGAMWCGTPAPAPAPPASPCAGCRGEHACIWSDGLCYPRVAREACEGTQGATWCGMGSEPEPEPEPVNMYEQVEGVGAWGGYCTCPDGQRYNVGDRNDGCAAGPGSLACVGGTPGECMREVDDARKGMQVTCAPELEPKPASAMQVAPHGPTAARKKISTHRQGFLATALLQAAAALERVAGVRDGAEEL